MHMGSSPFRVLKYVRQKLEKLKAEICKLIIMVGDFNTPLSEMDKFRRQNVNKDRLKSSTSSVSWI